MPIFQVQFAISCCIISFHFPIFVVFKVTYLNFTYSRISGRGGLSTLARAKHFMWLRTKHMLSRIVSYFNIFFFSFCLSRLEIKSHDTLIFFPFCENYTSLMFNNEVLPISGNLAMIVKRVKELNIGKSNIFEASTWKLNIYESSSRRYMLPLVECTCIRQMHLHK